MTTILQGLAFDDLDAGIDDDKGVRSLVHGGTPELHPCASEVELKATVAKQVQALIVGGAQPSTICVVAHSKWELEALEKMVAAVCPKIKRIEPDQADKGDSDELRTATIHRVKGLEFDHVVLAGKLAGYGTEEVSTENRSLLYVAATRARKSLTICHTLGVKQS